MNSTPPLVVDLDGSLLRGDSLHESVAASLTRPGVLLGAARALVTSGRAALKRYLAERTDVDTDLLPVNQAVLDFVRAEHASGRKIYLATGADSSLSAAMVRRFPEFDGSFGSDGETNLTSENKVDLLVAKFGAQGFDYVGNSTKDLAVWRQANRSYLVTPSTSGAAMPGWARGVDFAGVLREQGRPIWRVWLKELRVHQSLKNLLLFLPLLAAHEFGDARLVLLLVAGFISFTFMASSVYLLNDLLDLRSDRMHARKSQRPLAAGLILPLHALVVSLLLAVVALAGAVAIGVGFTVVLVSYAVLTCLYSFWLKRVTLVDVTVLAMLYMIRIIAGAVIAGISLSFWFTGVALFLFVSLALVKRYTELSRPVAPDAHHGLPGRGYVRSDAAVVLPLGIGAGMAVLLLLAIYLQTDAVARLYPSGVFLWLVIPAMFYWIANMWIQAGRGAMHDDPIIFALKNPASLISVAITGVLFLAASTPLASMIKQALTWLGAR